jgi:hypothetical protein
VVADGLLNVNGAHLVQHESGRLAAHGNFGPEHVWMCRRGGRSDDRRRQIESVGLHHHGVPAALLLVTHGIAGSAQPVYVTTH